MATIKNGQITFRYCATDTTTGVTRYTVRRMAQQLGINETQVIHCALRALAVKILPQYEQDDGALNVRQMQQIRNAAPKKRCGSVRSNLFEIEST